MLVGAPLERLVIPYPREPGHAACAARRTHRESADFILKSMLVARLLSLFGVVSISLREQGGNECAEECLPLMAGVAEEAGIRGQLRLRDAVVWPQPGAEQRPGTFRRVDMDLAEASSPRFSRPATYCGVQPSSRRSRTNRSRRSSRSRTAGRHRGCSR
jgi:hypothetical protein